MLDHRPFRRRITLREFVFGREYSLGDLAQDAQFVRQLLPQDKLEWLDAHHITPSVSVWSAYDYSTCSVRFCIYAHVPDSLATYYLLRWGNAAPEEHQYLLPPGAR